MTNLKDAVDDFLAQKRIAVAGVSRNGTEAANAIYKKFKGAGYEVFPVNPNAAEVEGVPCYPDLKSVPGGVDAVMVATPPKGTDAVMQECAEIGVTRAWIHSSIGDGSYSKTAVEFGRKHGITVIPAGCPMMFVEPVDFGHKCMKWIFGKTGKIPKTV